MFEPNNILPQTTENTIDFTKSTINTSTKSQQISNVPSFASKTAAEHLPKRELAIVFNTIENIPQIEYLIALSKIISPKHITYASRVSNGRFCVYLSNKDIIDKLLSNHHNITINNQTINIRRLINPAKKN